MSAIKSVSFTFYFNSKDIELKMKKNEKEKITHQKTNRFNKTGGTNGQTDRHSCNCLSNTTSNTYLPTTTSIIQIKY